MDFVREGHVAVANAVVGVHPLGEPILNNNSSLVAKNGTLSEDPVHTDDAMIDIVPRNVVCSFSVGCHLDLKKIAWHGCNVQFKPASNVVLMKLRHPLCTAHIWSSGKVTCTGSNTEADAKRAGRKIARFLQKLDFPVKFRNYRIVNVLATCSLPFGVDLPGLARLDKVNASYEPELHPGVTYKCKDLSASLKVFSTGSVTITAPSLLNVQSAVERVYPYCSACQKSKDPGRKRDCAEELDIIDNEVDGWDEESNDSV